MSLIKTIEHNPDFEPVQSKPEADRLISGDPAFKSWPQDADKGDKVRTGVWEATPGVTHSRKGTMYEFCHILSGVVEMKPGFVGVWRTVETVRKIFVCVYE